MNRTLPLFPLDVVVFPGEKLNLHIFEPRYQQLVKDVMETEASFCIPAFIRKTVMEFGTEIRILGIDKIHENGSLDIRCKGLEVVWIKEFYRQLPDKLYAGALVEEYPDLKEDEPSLAAELIAQVRRLHQVLGIESLYLASEKEPKTFQLAHQLGLNLEQEYMLLSLRKESLRQRYLLQHLQQIIPIIEETERLKERIKLNGHFKHLSAPGF